MNSYVQQANVSDPSNPTYMPGGAAQASIDYQTVMVTNGPVRSGYLQLAFTPESTFFYDGFARSTIGIQVPDATLITEVSCDASPSPGANCFPGPTYYQRNGLIPAMLGSSYALSATGTLNNVAVGFDGSSSGFLSLTYRFRFLEADQATGVQVFEESEISPAPEPSTWTLLIAGSGLFAAGAFRRR